jgi:plasmid stability protein
MLRNTTINLPDHLVNQAKAYAAAHGTTMTALIRNYLELVTNDGEVVPQNDPLFEFSTGKLSRNDAMKEVGVRDYAGLLIALGQADLPIPIQPAHEIENQAAVFVKLWKQI